MVDVMLIGAGLGIGGVGFFAGFKKMKQYKLINDIPRSKVRSLAMGLVEIHGKVSAKNTLISPFSKTPCIYYKYEIKEYQRSGKSSRWVTINSGEEHIPFWAKDETGQIYVNPDGAEFNIPLSKKYSQKAKFGMQIGPIILALRKKNLTQQPESLGLKLVEGRMGFVGIGDRIYQEHYIKPEEDLFVMGTAANVPGAPEKVMIRKGGNEPTYIISNKSEAVLLKRIKWQMFGAFGIGIGAIVMAVYEMLVGFE